VVVSGGSGSGVVSGGLGGSGVSAGVVFSTVFGSGLFSVLGAWVVSSTVVVDPRSDVGGGSLFKNDPAKKAASADSKNTTTTLISHSRARPHLEMLQATDHNPSRIFSASTNVKAYVYVLTAPNARAKTHLRATTRHDRYREKRGRAPTSAAENPGLLRMVPTGPRGQTRGCVDLLEARLRA
jgi:hypothetical protein